MTPAENLTSRTARATQWRLASVLVSTLARLAIGILLARLLTPADFGTVALAYVVLGFVSPLNDLGIGAALVQRVELTDRHLRVAFTSSLGLGLAVALGMVAAAPAAARVLGDTAVAPVLRTLSLAFVMSSTATVAGAMLQRQLDFKRQSFVDTGSHLLGYGGVAITLALLGYGVWSLVWGALVQALVAAIAQLVIVQHPVRPLLAHRELRDLLHFGFGSTVNALVSYAALNGDNFVVGRWIGAAGLGLYSRAYGLMNLPHTLFASVVTRVLFPAFSRAQGDPARLRRAYLLVTGLTAMIAAPAMATLAVAAPYLVPGLYGPHWSGVVIPLQILCFAGYFRAVYHLGGVVLRSVGWVYRWLPLHAVYAGLVLGLASAGSRYGLAGVATGVAVAILYMFVATGQLALSATGTSWAVYVLAQRGAIVTAGAACGVAFFIRAVFEALDAANLTIAIAIVAGASVPWTAGMLWLLAKPEFEPVRAHLPPILVRLLGTAHRTWPPAAIRRRAPMGGGDG
jgi:PST family polysaccharide transporter